MLAAKPSTDADAITQLHGSGDSVYFFVHNEDGENSDIPMSRDIGVAALKKVIKLMRGLCRWIRQRCSGACWCCLLWVGGAQAEETMRPLLTDTVGLTERSEELCKTGVASRVSSIFSRKKRQGSFTRVDGKRIAPSQPVYAPPRADKGTNPVGGTISLRRSQHSVTAAVLAGGDYESYSDQESSTSSCVHSNGVPGERWIMQNGVLVSVEPEEYAREVTDSRVDFFGDIADTCWRRVHKGCRKIINRDGFTRGNEMGTAVRASHAIKNVGTVLEELESYRVPVQTLDQLIDFLACCVDFLPVRIEVEREIAPFSHSITECSLGDAPPGVEYTLHILGPLQPNPYTAVLSVLEDVIMDDCDSSQLCLVGVHCSDLNFSSHLSASKVGDGDLFGTDAGGTLMHRSSQSRAGLDNLMSSPYVIQQQAIEWSHTLDGADSGYDLDRSPLLSSGKPLPEILASQNPQELLKESHMRVLAFLKNLMDNMANNIHMVRLTRCTFAPIDIGHSLPLTLSPLSQLIFEQCPLSPAHIDALLQLARIETRRYIASAFLVEQPQPALSRLTELQLSGTLSDECIVDFLNYLQDEVVAETGPALKALRLPSLLLEAAKAHPFIQSHPHLQIFPLV